MLPSQYGRIILVQLANEFKVLSRESIPLARSMEVLGINSELPNIVLLFM